MEEANHRGTHRFADKTLAAIIELVKEREVSCICVVHKEEMHEEIEGKDY
jgi:hypothetical protein